MDDRRALARSAGLLVIAFVATLTLLFGLAIGFGGRAGPVAEATPTASPEASAGVSPSAVATVTPTSPPPPTAGPTPSGDPVLVGAGDIASCGLDGDEATAKLLDGIAGTVFTAGDNAYDDGSDENFAQCYEPTWGRHKSRTRSTPGNHDYQTKDAKGYRDYFGAAALNEDGDTWYSFDLGTWHIVMLDSNCGAIGGCETESPEGVWLGADLAAHSTTCTLAIWHHPRFSSGDEHGNDPRTDPFWRLLYAAGADVIVNGHDHDYERFAPQNPDGQEDRAKGIREFVAGTGGASLRGFNPPVANSELRVAVTHGVLQLTLHPQSYDWQWIPTDGLVSDRGSGPCH